MDHTDDEIMCYNIPDKRPYICPFCLKPIRYGDECYDIEIKMKGDDYDVGSKRVHIDCFPVNCEPLLHVKYYTPEEEAERKIRIEQEKKDSICPDCGHHKYVNWMNCPTCAAVVNAENIKMKKHLRVQNMIARDVIKKH